MSAPAQETAIEPIPDEYVDWFVSFLQNGEASDVTRA